MPTYIMKDPDGVEQEFLCTIAEMQAKKVLGWTMVFQPVSYTHLTLPTKA